MPTQLSVSWNRLSLNKAIIIPYLKGGIITYSFSCTSSGNQYVGPGTPAPGTALYADVLSLSASD
ncbi:hypothetical protein [Metallosphaera javensis (ex Hofmann et al. 2022)]|uniref:hypothetical protein n=1 Tax=Metallosphaera javensis (ex Hofmann et al. 2022) TaxID=99938 RepID=UPI001EDE8F8B|nr:hypothetical protein [Metallosphaera javensis (ex Hofmann et al. 2022)]